jgi:hypothetical protein
MMPTMKSVEVFSVYGNLQLRKNMSGVAVTFKVLFLSFCALCAVLCVCSDTKQSQGAKDMEGVRRMVNCLVKKKKGSSSNDGEDEEEYKVHMAVLTASLGKKMPIVQGNIMTRCLDAAVEKRGGSVYYVPRYDEVHTLFCMGASLNNRK